MQHSLYIYTRIESTLCRDPELGRAQVLIVALTNRVHQLENMRKQGLLLTFFAKCIIIIRWNEAQPHWTFTSAAGQYRFHMSNL